ncbi:hypothetical protein QVD17_27007 [Tagetes erecta]|uniref:No apical meristem-associated C-terminal domain-containing protein n=1 Tax=Tagetes erecta TaxID=13708 RepID=A0AAD8NR96_TARER|nr:hypothetical protein QVD17_27007 [Tagetes erecta]
MNQLNITHKKKKKKVVASSASKRQPWTIADDELLTKGFLHVSNDSIVGNARKSTDLWKRVLEYYMERQRSSALRTADNLRSHWHMIKNNATSFNNIIIQLREQRGSDFSDDQLKTQAHSVYFEKHNTHFIHEHVWNLVKDEPKWKKQIDIQEPKRTKTFASLEYTMSDVNAPNDDVDDAPLSIEDCEVNELACDDVDDVHLSLEDCEVNELPHPTSTEKAKEIPSKGNDIEDTAKVDNIFHKMVDVLEQFNVKMTQMLELKEKKLEMEILYKDRSKMDPETLEFHKRHCSIIREKYDQKK